MQSMRTAFSIVLSIAVALTLVLVLMGDADAKKRKKRGNPKYAAYVIDAKTGKVLHSRNANARRYPASLTKMMTVYLMFEELKSGRLKLSDRVVMTKAGARRVPSKLGIRAGQSISVEQAIYSLVTKSANDVATAVADKLSGNEVAFARRMTHKARQLGMRRTTFKNANGLTERGQVTTAADMAKLGLALREHFPRRYKYFQTRVFKFGRKKMRNHNRLLGKVRGVDGIKTGYTSASGFNLVSSVSTGGRRIVAVVMGGRSGRSRNAQMHKLIRTYLPKASRGSSRRLIARATSSAPAAVRVASASPALPRVLTTPTWPNRANDKIAERIGDAHAGSTPSEREIASIKTSVSASLASATAATPAMRAVSQDRSQTLDSFTTASVDQKRKPVKKAAPKGWQIQIGAGRNKSKAMAMLKKARKRGGRALAGTQINLSRSIARGKQFYRARFVGFSSKRNAKRACRALKRKRFDCFAINS